MRLSENDPVFLTELEQTEGYIMLAKRVVEQAVEDYEKALRYPHRKDSAKDIQECEYFFEDRVTRDFNGHVIKHSNFSLYTDLNGHYLERKIREWAKMKKKRKTHKARNATCL